MADNVTFTTGDPATPPAATVVATDEIGGKHYQRVKLTHGADGTADDVSSTSPLEVTLANTGANATAVKVDNSAVTQPVSDASGSLTVDAPVGTPVFVRLSSGSTAVDTIPVSLAANQSVNVAQVAGATVATGHGTASGAVRVELPTDGTGLVNAAQSGTWTVQPGNTANTTAWKVDASSVAVPVTDNSGSLTVDNAGTFAVQAAQSGNWTARVVGNAGATVDSTVGAGTAPTNMLAVGGLYNSTEISPSTGQAASLQLDSKGRLRGVIYDAAGNTRGANVNASSQLSVSMDGGTGGSVTLLASTATIGALTANQSVNVAQINGVTPLMGAGNTGTGSHRVTVATDNAAIATWGLGATGSAVPSGAQYEGGNAITALPTAATAGNLTGASFDKYGRQVVLPVTIRDLVGTQTTTISASTSETTIVTAASGVFNDIVMLIVSNTSSGTNTRIDIRDTTAGSVLFSLQSNGGQPPIGFALPVPIPQTSSNTNWTATCATSTTDIRVYAVFAKNK